MKVRLYMDLWPYGDMSTVTASTRPGVKADTATRLAFDVVIPDHVYSKVMQVDKVSPEDSVAEIVKEAEK